MTDDIERQCREALARLQREYQERAQPYIDTLAKIEAMRPPPPIVVDLVKLSEGQLRDLRNSMMPRESFADRCVDCAQTARDRLT